jgi:hypothetical protein
VVLKLRPDDDKTLSKPYFGYFNGKKRKFSLQVQGRFKKDATGIVWLGAEVGHDNVAKCGLDFMSLGFVKNMLCKLVLKTINFLKSDTRLHYSFGTRPDTNPTPSANSTVQNTAGDLNGASNNSASEIVLPHITLPLAQAVDTFVETKDPDSPPPIGVEMFPETAAQQKVRKKTFKKTHAFRSDCTYSFNMHNGNLNICDWKVNGIPGASDMDLVDYWGDKPLRVVAYLIDGPENTPHTAANKQYLFCFKVANTRAQRRYHAKHPNAKQDKKAKLPKTNQQQQKWSDIQTRPRVSSGAVCEKFRPHAVRRHTVV